ncbi:hypothetical protein JW926_16275 [Candidatus Sumerlaeota bacterium]|nr:hypothetical protein [Candidatus Sumerlaeota bacterium]
MEPVNTPRNHEKVPPHNRLWNIIVLVFSITLFSTAFVLSLFQEKTDIQAISYAVLFRSIALSFFMLCAAFAVGSREMQFFDKLIRSHQAANGVSDWSFRYRTRCIFSFAIGLGTLGFLVLGLGSLHLLKKEIVWLVFSLLFLSGFPHFRAFFSKLRFWLRSLSQDKKCDLFTISAIIFLAFILVLYFICALPLPIQYDVLEYHLGSLSQSLREGSIQPQPCVFYSYMPFGAESLFAAGLLLDGRGVYFMPKLLNWGFWLLSFIGIYIFLELAGLSRNLRLLGLILFALNRLAFSVALDAFVEPLQTVYVLSALCSWTLSWKLKKEGFLYFSFIFWGLALGVKLSILGIGIIPYMAILVPAGLFIMKSGDDDTKTFSLKNWIRTLGWGAVITGAVFLPWMIRNIVHAGNPVFPFLSGIFRWERWMPEQMNYYLQVNRTAAPFSLGNLQIQLIKWRDMSALVFLPIFLIPILYRKAPWALALAGFAIAGYLVQNAWIEPPARFLVPLIPVFILLTLLVLKRLMVLTQFGRLLPALYVILMILIYQLHFVELYNSGYLKAALFSFQQDDFLREQLGWYKEAADFINEQLPENAGILSLYEARSLYIERRVLTNTVFDKSPLLDMASRVKNAGEIRAGLRERGITHVMVNEVELNRQIHIYAPKEKIAGNKKEGMELSVSPLLQDPYSNLTAFTDLYGPYHFDSRFPENRKKIREFLSLLQKDIIFERTDERGLRFYISPLDNK